MGETKVREWTQDTEQEKKAGRLVMGRNPDRPIITLTTDFGLLDPYAGQLKGALLSACPAAVIIDLTHAIPAWDVVTAAITIRTSYRFFPSGTIHLIVVDPGVGSRRAILVAEGDGHFFIAPDNGIFSLLVADRRLDAVHRLERADFFSSTVSPTFHGRDIMAPVAGTLARGVPLTYFGPEVDQQGLTLAILPSAETRPGIIQGQVLRVDHFGNIRTSVRADRLGSTAAGFGDLEINGRRITTLAKTYEEVPLGSLMVLVDSSGFLEIAANRGRAVELLGCRPGDPILVHLVS